MGLCTHHDVELPAIPVEEGWNGTRLGCGSFEGALVDCTGGAYRSARGCHPVGGEAAIRFVAKPARSGLVPTCTVSAFIRTWPTLALSDNPGLRTSLNLERTIHW